MLKELISNHKNYFCSINTKGNITIGGYNAGKFYGVIKIILNNEKAILSIWVSNGISSAKLLPLREYSSATHDYSRVKILCENIKNYLKKRETIIYQELNREHLMCNVFNLLPKYKDIKP